MSKQQTVRVNPADYLKSCDWCAYQEGRHYCLLHGIAMKNMDAVACDKWKQRRAMRAISIIARLAQ